MRESPRRDDIGQYIRGSPCHMKGKPRNERSRTGSSRRHPDRRQDGHRTARRATDAGANRSRRVQPLPATASRFSTPAMQTPPLTTRPSRSSTAKRVACTTAVTRSNNWRRRSPSSRWLICSSTGNCRRPSRPSSSSPECATPNWSFTSGWRSFLTLSRSPCTRWRCCPSPPRP